MTKNWTTCTATYLLQWSGLCWNWNAKRVSVSDRLRVWQEGGGRLWVLCRVHGHKIYTLNSSPLRLVQGPVAEYPCGTAATTPQSPTIPSPSWSQSVFECVNAHPLIHSRNFRWANQWKWRVHGGCCRRGLYVDSDIFEKYMHESHFVLSHYLKFNDGMKFWSSECAIVRSVHGCAVVATPKTSAHLSSTLAPCSAHRHQIYQSVVPVRCHHRY